MHKILSFKEKPISPNSDMIPMQTNVITHSVLTFSKQIFLHKTQLPKHFL